ncbi:hypothetical protein [Psychromonas sp. MME2]|uniref:hypothetical protein n=1 Tax=unclassified Psychromonas TaxID=2614957 RepID=UPI00339D0D22
MNLQYKIKNKRETVSLIKKYLLNIVLTAFAAITLLQPSTTLAATITEVIYPKHSQRSEFYSKVLELALQKTEAEYGEFELKSYDKEASTERLRHSLMVGQDVTVLWSSSSKERDEKYLPVKVNLLKGLNRFRFIVIRSSDKARFDAVDNLTKLRAFTAGSGTYWSDTKVLFENDLPVVTTLNHDILKLLGANRFDYVLRGAYEVWSELASNEEKFTIFEKLLICYSGEYYFYLNKSNTLLAERLEKGINLALADGSFDKLFFGVSDFKKGWDKIYNNRYHVVQLSK